MYIKKNRFDNESFIEVNKFDKLYINKIMPNLELLHFEGVNMIEYEGNSKKKKKRQLDHDMEDNFSISFSNLHTNSFLKLKNLILIDVVITNKFFE